MRGCLVQGQPPTDTVQAGFEVENRASVHPVAALDPVRRRPPLKASPKLVASRNGPTEMIVSVAIGLDCQSFPSDNRNSPRIAGGLAGGVLNKAAKNGETR